MFVVIVVWFWSSPWLSFLIMADIINVMWHFGSTGLFAFEAVFVLTHFLLKNTWIFGVFYLFLFGRHLCQKCGWAGSELDVQTHITEPPCFVNINKKSDFNMSKGISLHNVDFKWLEILLITCCVYSSCWKLFFVNFFCKFCF